ncbi:MAG TPA: hypothetical protein VFA52_00180 [Candidatus Paceibacterota bacterium]|nr:hypothetical protein [Candidatus Paceibacterota bacterium]
MEKPPESEIAGQHEKISYTAIGVAYARTFSDIPYSAEISKICDASNLTPENAEIHERMSPYFEGRFKALSNLIKKSGIKNILELASGVSPRDLLLTQDSLVNYIETDLPDMLRQKKAVLAELVKGKGIKIPPNLHFAELNVLDKNSFKKVIEQFPSGPIVIGHEGLVAYFNREEKEKMATIIREVLIDRGGIWITPDIFTLSDMEKLNTGGKRKEALEEIKKRTGRDYASNAFIDLDDAKKFFTDLGFEFNIQTLKETAGDIQSAKIGLNEESVQKQLSWNIWELKTNVPK